MGSFPGKSALRYIYRVKADDVMVTFLFVSSAVFLKCFVRHPAFNIKCIRIAIKPILIEFISQDFLPQFIPQDFAGLLIMLKQQVLHRVRIIGIMAFYVFEDCQYNHLPIEALLSAVHIVPRWLVVSLPAWQESALRHC